MIDLNLFRATHSRSVDATHLLAEKNPTKRFGFRRGATLLEVTFVLLIFVAIIGGALTMASSTMSQSSATEELQTLTNLSAAVRKTKTNTGYPANIEGDLRVLAMIPSNIVDTGTDTDQDGLSNSWGGAITFTQIDSGANFSVTYSGIPKQECITLVNSTKSGILQSVGASAAAMINLADLTPAQVNTTVCAAASDNTVIWSSKIE